MDIKWFNGGWNYVNRHTHPQTSPHPTPPHIVSPSPPWPKNHWKYFSQFHDIRNSMTEIFSKLNWRNSNKLPCIIFTCERHMLFLIYLIEYPTINSSLLLTNEIISLSQFVISRYQHHPATFHAQSQRLVNLNLSNWEIVVLYAVLSSNSTIKQR